MPELNLEVEPEPSARADRVVVAPPRRALRGTPEGGVRAEARGHDGQRRAPTVPIAVAGEGVVTLHLDDALVVPAGALVRGGLRARSLLLAGEVVGNVRCGTGPVVILAGATLRGRLVADGDVYVCGAVVDGCGGVVITARGKLTLAPGAHVEGDVRTGRLALHEGATLQGVARACGE